MNEINKYFKEKEFYANKYPDIFLKIKIINESLFNKIDA